MRARLGASAVAICCAAFPALAEPVPIARWSFDGGQAGANAVPGAPAGRVERADAAEGRSGKALLFTDWSVRNYLKPDPRVATRMVVAHDPKLNPPLPFRVSAWIFPTADPVYYGGIVEKGRGFGASYRLVLLRGLKVEASAGDRHVTVRSASPLSLNEWHEVALVVASGSLALLVDGKEAGRAPLGPDLKIASGDPLVVGERFTGRIDDVAISAE